MPNRMPKTPVNTVYLIDSLESGGAQRQVVELIKGLNRKLINPYVVVYHNIMYFREELEQSDVKIYCLPKKDKLGISFIIQFLNFIYKKKIKLIHSFLNTPNLYARLTKLFFPHIVIVTSERNVTLVHSIFRSVLEKLTWRLSDRIIVNAEKIKDLLVNKIGVAPEVVRVVNNGIDLKRFSSPDKLLTERIRAEALTGRASFLIGIIGRICVQKGQVYAVEAARLIRQSRPEIDFVMCFWGSETELTYAETIKRMITEYNLVENVHFCGERKEMPEVMAASDLLILPSLWEGFPNVLLEAIASRAMIISTDIVNNRQIVVNDEAGFLIEPKNPKALAEKIIDVYQMSQPDAERLVTKAYEHITNHFSRENLVKKTMDVYVEARILPTSYSGTLTVKMADGVDDEERYLS